MKKYCSMVLLWDAFKPRQNFFQRSEMYHFAVFHIDFLMNKVLLIALLSLTILHQVNFVCLLFILSILRGFCRFVIAEIGYILLAQTSKYPWLN